jgi:nitroimidazol reductase NimA-like FMN-containing flavoprotein (pyridoxamine 5'-phosphate oxidase superfamily)
MVDANSLEMDDDERDEFLGTGGTGVIAFAADSTELPHAVPVSYGYDAAESQFYFRLAVGPDSGKAEPAGRAVAFVTYGRGADEEWRSVVARGRLAAVDEPSIATETLQGLRRVHIPLVDVFGAPPGDVPLGFYRLDPETLTSRKEASTGD